MSVIGLDLGTSRVKAVRFDAEWRVADVAAEPTTVLRPRPGWSEQHLGEVWRAAARVTRRVAAPDVDLLAVTAQGDGCWLVDRNGKPIRPALLWNDNRASGVVSAWAEDGTLDAAFQATGCYGFPGLAHAQLRWLAEHEPRTLSLAATLLSCGSWTYFRLTGQRVLHVSDAGNPFLDAQTGSYAASLLERYGLAPWRRLLPPAVAGPATVGALRPDAAADVGLAPGTQVALAPYDVVATAVGVGAVRPGQGFAVLGTTMCVGSVAGSPMLDRRPPNGMTLLTGRPDRWLVAFATLTGTEVLDWVAGLLGLADAAEVVALAETAELVDPPIFLPYLSPAGERAPFLDAAARGTLAGLSLGHQRADIARAAVDGLTLALCDCLAAVGEVSTLTVTGGGARSEPWCQAISDATGRSVACANTAETGARGAALSGAVAVGRFRDEEQAADEVAQPDHLHVPDPARRGYYRTAYARFVRARTSGAQRL